MRISALFIVFFYLNVDFAIFIAVFREIFLYAKKIVFLYAFIDKVAINIHSKHIKRNQYTS